MALYCDAVSQWASYQIREIVGCACAGNVFPCRRFQRKPLVTDPGMHHGTCVTHVPWCMSGSLTCGDRENVPGIPGACAPAILRIWQEAHGLAHTQNDHWKYQHSKCREILLDFNNHLGLCHQFVKVSSKTSIIEKKQCLFRQHCSWWWSKALSGDQIRARVFWQTQIHK